MPFFNSCPTEDEVAALHEGRLADPAASALRDHVDGCSACLATLAALASGSRHTGVAAVEPWWDVPEAFDGYRVLRPLGRGGMGHVYLGHEVALDRPVALKFVAAARPDDTALSRFLTEARAIARLQHPNVVAIYRTGEVLGRPYLAYEFVDGPSLDRLDKPLRWQDALPIAVGLARGLAVAHQRDVLHRDIKPANAILAPSGDVKLLDFGLAKLAHDVQHEPAAADDVLDRMAHAGGDLTITGALVGTPGYLAPEVWRGDPATARSDLFSLGVLLFELLTGRRPHGDGLALPDLARRVASADAPPVRSLCPDLPEPFAAVIDRCLARDPEARFPTAAALRDALEAVDAFRRAFAPVRVAAAPDAEEVQRLVPASFTRLAPCADQLVRRFYERFFNAYPGMRALFPADMGEQRSKLGAALRLAVENLGAPDALAPLLEDLGRRHGRLGITRGHFDALGRALLLTLAELEGEAWSPALAVAWERAFGRIAELMMRGIAAAESEPSPPPAAFAPPDTRFTENDGVSLAYQTMGRGPVDVVIVPAWVTHLETAWKWHGYERLARALARAARLIVYDQRGTGLSERSRPPASDAERVDDLRAVLDAAGSRRAIIVGPGPGAGVALLFAARHPQRCRALVTFGARSLTPSPPDEAAGEQIRVGWGGPLFLDQLAPAADDLLRHWWASYLRTGASPSAAIAVRRLDASIDAGPAIAAVRAPSLVLRRRGDRAAPIDVSRELAARLPGARFLELPGDEHLLFCGDVESVAAEILSFAGALDETRALSVAAVSETVQLDPSGDGLTFVTRAEMDAVDPALWDALPPHLAGRLPARLTATERNTLLLRRAFVVTPDFVDRLLARVGHVEGEPWLLWKLVAAFHLVGREVGPATVLNAGKHVFAAMPRPPGIRGVAGALRALGDTFRAAHHDAPADLAGGFRITADEPGRIVIDDSSLYPCHFGEGTIAGICAAFAAEGATYRLLDEPPPKRAGGAATRFEITYRAA